MSGNRFSLIIVYITLLASIIGKVEARRRRRRRNQGILSDDAYSVLKWILVFAFGVPVFLFFCRVYNDPLTPHIFRELYMRVKDRFVMTVGGPEAKARAKRAAARRRREFIRARRGAVEFEYGYDEDDPNALFRRRVGRNNL